MQLLSLYTYKIIILDYRNAVYDGKILKDNELYSWVLYNRLSGWKNV